MDNFMDKLSKRFNAGDIMSANAAAEARELDRAKEQAQQYEQMMQEMRRLNLKNVEVTEQVQQLIRSGIEQFESYERSDEMADDISRQNKQLGEALAVMKEETLQGFESGEKAISSQILQTKTDLDENLANNLSLVRELAGKLQVLQNAVDELSGKLSTEEDKEQPGIDQLKESVDAMKPIVTGLQDYIHRENVKVYRNVQAVVSDTATQKARELGDRLDLVEKNSKSAKAVMPVAVLAMLFSLAGLVLQILTQFGVL